MTPLSWPPAAPGFAALMLLCAACFALYHYRCRAALLAERHHLSPLAAIVAQRLAGVVLLGVVPALVAGWLHPRAPAALGLTLPDPAAAALGALGLTAVALPAVVLASRRPDFVEHYPELRAPFTARVAAVNAAAWVAYLCAYEFFFRGLVLSALAERLDPWSAIALTTLAYVFAHLPKPGRETAGTVPMGVAFAAVTLATGSIWPAVVAHALIANTSDLLAARVLLLRRAAATPGDRSGSALR